MPSRLDLDTFWVPHRIQNRIAMAAQEQLHDMLKIITPPTRNTSFEWPKGSPMAPKMTSKALQKTMPFLYHELSETASTWPHLGPNLVPTWPQLGPTRANLGSTWANLAQLSPACGQVGAYRANLGPTWSQLGLTWCKLWPTWSQLGPINSSHPANVQPSGRRHEA